MTDKDTQFGADLTAALQEVRAHRRGEIALPSRIVEPMSGADVKAAQTPRQEPARV